MSSGLRQEHRVFGSLLGIWLGFFFSQRFPLEKFESLGFVVYVLTIIVSIAVLLQVAFSRTTLKSRLVPYGILLSVAALFIPGILYVSGSAYPGQLSEWEMSFLLIILLFWFFAAEISTRLQTWLDR